MDDTFEGRPNPVVVFGRDGIELMVMAFRAVDRQAQEGAPGRCDHVVEGSGSDDLLRDQVLIVDVIIGPGDEERAADLDLGLELPDHVASEVLAYELVEGLVLVERADDVVPEWVKVIDDNVALEAVALAEADDVEPVAAPAFAVARRGEQAIDEGFGRFAGVGLVGSDEGIDFGLRGREARKVVTDAADERLRSGGGVAGEFLLGELGGDEAIDVGVLEFFGERLERPPGLVGPLRFGGGLRARIGGAHLDPGRQVGQHGVRQLRLLRRHLHILLDVQDRS